LQELMGKYVRHLEFERGVSPYTVRNYTGDIKGFLDFLAEKGIRSLDKVELTTLRSYLGRLHDRGIARSSINRKASALRSFFRYLGQAEILDSEPTATLSAPKMDKRLPTFLTHGEMALLIEAPDTSTVLGLRDRAILELLYAAGLRVSEIVSLDLGDIDLGSRQLRVWGKGSKERVALMGAPAAEAIERYLNDGRIRLEGSSPTSAVFLNRFGNRIATRRIQHMVKRYARQAGLDLEAFPHIMRHTFATHMLDGGADLRVVQDLMGHSRLSTTQIYTHVTQSQIRRSYLAAHPRSEQEEEQ
jgi:integrase/recombinase XerC